MKKIQNKYSEGIAVKESFIVTMFIVKYGAWAFDIKCYFFKQFFPNNLKKLATLLKLNQTVIINQLIN